MKNEAAVIQQIYTAYSAITRIFAAIWRGILHFTAASLGFYAFLQAMESFFGLKERRLQKRILTGLLLQTDTLEFSDDFLRRSLCCQTDDDDHGQ